MQAAEELCRCCPLHHTIRCYPLHHTMLVAGLLSNPHTQQHGLISDQLCRWCKAMICLRYLLVMA